MFGLKLRDIRTSKGWTRQKLAAESGLCPDHIARWEDNTQVPSWDAMLNLCLALDVECAAFGGFDIVCWQGGSAA
ncbi:helix-turn-helix domain-containing protein [Limnoglobus roseus]|uniref:XRE family transcriptional regulator n=1 Tax=Limnoglobus roseus TaxID=2598579 RepID=A0A5C1AUA8_9BACT|nr:helix-turn-helix transcriptional regulator [Limnoglobus roseus]QEL20824.1 XRE family transcriptional regulator [Limnoglobus roseus]